MREIGLFLEEEEKPNHRKNQTNGVQEKPQAPNNINTLSPPTPS